MTQTQSLNQMCPSAKDAAVGTKLDDTITLVRELHDDAATNKTVLDELTSTINELITQFGADLVVPTGTVAGLDIDDINAENVETNNTIVIRHNGLYYTISATAEADISALSAAGATIAQAKHGIGWVFSNTAGTVDVEVDKDAQSYDTAIEAWSAYSTAANTLPPGTDDVCISAIHVEEGNSGTWTWGTDSISGETEAFHDFSGLPGIETALASFALEASSSTFSYGTATVRLGTGTRVAATGETGVTISGSNVATTKTGAWLFYLLADDTAHAEQLGAAYASLSAAQTAVRDHTPNPMLALAGVIYVQNDTAGDFVPGTTNLDATDITVTFTKIGPAANWLEFGRAALGQPNQVLQNASAGTLTASKPDTLTS